MSYGTHDRPGGPTLEDFIARQHWAMIGSGALFQVGLLGLTSVLLAVPVTMALALVHLMALVSACFGAMAAESLAERGDRPRAVLTGCRAVSSLVVSGLALVGLVLAVAGAAG